MIVYSKSDCPYCVKVKEFLDSNGYDYDVVDVTEEGVRDFLISKGHRTIPQVYTKEGTYIGDCDTTIKELS